MLKMFFTAKLDLTFSLWVHIDQKAHGMILELLKISQRIAIKTFLHVRLFFNYIWFNVS